MRALFRPFVWAFSKIAEPRIVRVIQFFVYALLAFAGGYVVGNPPPAFQSVVGVFFVSIFGGFLLTGGFVGALAVLPGVWWLERIGVIAIWTGLAIFAVIAVSLRVSPVGFVVAIALSLSLVLRWREIRLYQLAPRAR
jgi:hypothetical protein